MSTANEVGFDYQNFLKQTPTQPGVYRMYDKQHKVIYVGKAKDLKKRLASYFRKNLTHRKTANLVKQIQQIELTLTQTETEALLLEHNYIKKYQPKYNVLLRDDKSYPYILLSNDPHPRLSSYRGARQNKGDYFGPYPNSGAVKHTLNLLQQMFPIRQCDNNVYRNRSRPCLQYQIKRCLGPCVAGLVTEQTYQENVNYVKLFLKGHNEQVITHLVHKMDQASSELNFEQAAKYRDLIQAVRHTSTQQIILSSHHDLDVIGVATAHHLTTIHLLFIRQGQVLGSRNYYPKVPLNTELNEVLETFLGQFYLQTDQPRTLPQEILINYPLQETSLAEAITLFSQGKTQLNTSPSKEALKYIKLAEINAFNALQTKLQTRSSMAQRYQELEKTLNLNAIQRIECFDISHHQGEQTVASCVVFDRNGPVKAQYRRYLIKEITPGDDYAAMRNVLRRRYNKTLLEDKIPDLIIIDGGKSQLAQAITIFSELKVNWDKNKPLLLGIAKGVDRKAGLETLYTELSPQGIVLPHYSLALHLLQYVRDESHRHAITGHRNRMSITKIKKSSILETIPGIGAKRRQALLKNLGGLKPLLEATIEEIAKVPNISYKLAEKIYYALKS